MENSEMENMENADLLQPTDDLDLEIEDEEAESEETQPNLDVRHKDLPFVVNGVRVYGKRNPASVIEARCQRLYKRQLEGLTIRQLVLEHKDRESIAEATAWRDWNQVSQWNTDDWNIERNTILPRIQQMRFKIVNAAIKKGQLQTAVMALKDIGAVIAFQDSKRSDKEGTIANRSYGTKGYWRCYWGGSTGATSNACTYS